MCVCVYIVLSYNSEPMAAGSHPHESTRGFLLDNPVADKHRGQGSPTGQDFEAPCPGLVCACGQHPGQAADRLALDVTARRGTTGGATDLCGSHGIPGDLQSTRSSHTGTVHELTAAVSTYRQVCQMSVFGAARSGSRSRCPRGCTCTLASTPGVRRPECSFP